MVEAVVAAAVGDFALVEAAAVTTVSLDVHALVTEMKMIGFTFGSKDVVDHLFDPFGAACSFVTLLFHESMCEILGHLMLSNRLSFWPS